MSQYWSSNIHSLKPYTPGEQPQIDGLIKLNTNENPYGPSPKVLAAIGAANQADLRKYPDPSASKLKEAIAAHFFLNSKQVFVGNSSDEVLGHAFKAFFKQDVPLLFPDITYSFYPVYCQLFGIDYELIPLRDDFSICPSDYQCHSGGVIFANPNAPTGIALSLEGIATILDIHKDRVVLVDEAYVDFSQQSVVDLLPDYPNLLVTQTLSKSRSLAGLRAGFALGSVELITGLERVKNSFHPYTLDSLALAGAQASVEDREYFESTTQKIIATREHTRKLLQQLGFHVLPSQTNFLFAHHPQHPAEELFTHLRVNNILVRHFDKPRISDYLRISIGTDDEMDKLLECLSTFIGTQPDR